MGTIRLMTKKKKKTTRIQNVNGLPVTGLYTSGYSIFIIIFTDIFN